MARTMPVYLALGGLLCLLAAPVGARAQAPIQVPTQPPPDPPPVWNSAPALPYPIGVPQPGAPGGAPQQAAPGSVPPQQAVPVQPWQQPAGPIPAPPPYPYTGQPGVPTVSPPDVFARNQRAGWFSAFEVGLIEPQIHGQLSGSTTVGGVSVPVSLPFSSLDWTGSPRFELGYRFGQDMGAVLASYRSLVSSGTADLEGFDPLGSARLHTRLNLNSVDLDYASMDLPIAQAWDLRWDLGVRIAGVYYDSLAAGPSLEQHATNNFVGAGPHAAVEVYRQIDELPGFSFFGRLDGAVVIGGDSQSFETTIGPSGDQIGGTTRFHDSRSAPVLGMQLGLSYAPQHNPHWFRFTFGYQFEEWWGVGSAGGSRGDLSFQGLFFRGEFNY